MDTVNITQWWETSMVPLLTLMTATPLVAMIIVLLSPTKEFALRIGFISTALTLLMSIYLLLVFDPTISGIQFYEQVQNIIFTYTVGVDGTSVLFIPMTAILALLTLVYTLTNRHAAASDKTYIAALLGYEAILIGAFSALNALQFWFWCLLELIPVAIITIHSGTGQNRRWVMAHFLQHWVSGLLMILAGFLMLGFSIMGASDTLTFDWLDMQQSDDKVEYAVLVFFLLFFGFAIRMPLFPFHGWLPILAEQGTIASVGVLLVSLKLGIYAVIRYLIPILPETAEQWSWLVLVFGLIGILYGALLALMQINIRRLLAFAVISQTGILVIGIFAFNRYGLEGSMMLTIAFGLATAGMLFSIGMIYKRTNTSMIPRLGGMFDANAGIAILFVISALSTIVMPGTPGFDGIHLLIEGSIKEHGWLVSIVVLIGNVLAAALLLRAFQQIFIASPKRFQGPFRYSPKPAMPASTINETIIVTVICSLLIGIGFHTSPWLHMIDQGAGSIKEPHHSMHETQSLNQESVSTTRDN